MPATTRSIPFFVSLLQLAACGGSAGTDVDGPTASGPAGTLPSGSADGVSCGRGRSDYVAGADAARRAARCPVEVACARLHGGDCASACASPFAACGASYADCVMHYEAKYAGDADTPFVNEALAAVCAGQIASGSCLDLTPDTVACTYAIVEGCAADDDGYGANYGPTTPHEVGALPQTITPTLCRSVSEWYAVDAPPGASKLRITVAAAEDRHALEVQAYPPVEPPSTRLPDTELVHVRPGSSDVLSLPSAGRVLVRIELALAGDRREVTFTAE